MNFGGGHHITHPDYDVEGLIERIKAFQAKYQVQVYLEPGEAIAIHSGVLVSEVLDVNHYPEHPLPLAILDTSATRHMPDTRDALPRSYFRQRRIGDKEHSYRLGGQTCLAGDVMGDYSFDRP